MEILDNGEWEICMGDCGKAQRQEVPSEIPVEFALPLALFVHFLLAFFLAGLFPLLIFRPGFAQHIGKPAAYVPAPLPRRVIMLLAQITPGNPRQALLDLVLVQLLRLPPCGGAQRRQPGADMALPLFPGLGPGIARQLQPLAHFREHGLGLAHRMHPRAPLGQRFIVAALGLGDQLRAALDGIGGGAKLQLRLAVQLLGLQCRPRDSASSRCTSNDR
jgi:hypothetical protein